MKTGALDLPYTFFTSPCRKSSSYKLCHLHFRHYFLFPDERQDKKGGQYCTPPVKEYIKLTTFKIKQGQLCRSTQYLPGKYHSRAHLKSNTMVNYQTALLFTH